MRVMRTTHVRPRIARSVIGGIILSCAAQFASAGPAPHELASAPAVPQAQFDAQKQHLIGILDKQISQLSTVKNCVNAATTDAAVRKCVKPLTRNSTRTGRTAVTS